MKKICVVVASRANYGRVKYLMLEIQKHPFFELQVIVGASTLLERFGKAINIIKADGFNPKRSIHYVIEGENLTTQAKSTGLGILELASAFEDLRPDMVVTVADRFETMATAIAATYMNIPLIHLQGGEVSGNIDNRVRHAITQLADFHFVATEKSKNRVIKMGRPPNTVFNVGCPCIDVLCKEKKILNKRNLSKTKGTGINVDWDKPYILVLQHPVTTTYGKGRAQILETLHALCKFPEYQKVVLWPNADAGSDEVSKGIREFREKNQNKNFAYFKNFSPESYAAILSGASCCVGNSSSFIREGSFLGVPAVLVGDRQKQREMGKNCILSSYNASSIQFAIKKQLDKKRFKKIKLFGDGDAAKKIVKILGRLFLK